MLGLQAVKKYVDFTASKHSKQVDMPASKSLAGRRASNDVEGSRQLGNQKKPKQLKVHPKAPIVLHGI